MSTPKIKIAVLGHMPPEFEFRGLLKWNSDAFELDSNIETYDLNENGKGLDWEFDDEQLSGQIKRDSDSSFQVIFVSVKLEQNWYARRLADNRILFTFYELDQILRAYGLPLQNLALRLLYASTLIYKRYGNRIPPSSEVTSFAHDETRGCLFDMNASKTDVIYSLHQPKLCDYCVSQLKQAHVSNELISLVQKELRRIRKPLLDRIVSFVRAHTVWSILISIASAIAIGTLTSLLATVIYETIRAAR
jgi:hypothetical protein